MGIFSKNSRTTSRPAAATLIAKGCTISGKLKLESDIQVDGVVEGHIHVEGALIVAESGRVKGEIHTKQLLVNGILEGNCHAERIQILANGRVKGKIWSNDLSIEPGGKFFGETAELPDKEAIALKVPDEAASAKTDAKNIVSNRMVSKNIASKNIASEKPMHLETGHTKTELKTG
ncbi:bactofilin family protein [Vibrio sp. 10N.286.49.B1]|uniref:bactofilin family protein n=1 Tax=unclassified Vibrio TaxID=2614977 RepID=UPI000C820F67|nr:MULTISPECIES: polymer-forming cytoskeletal protein [unclassified Vibrio]